MAPPAWNADLWSASRGSAKLALKALHPPTSRAVFCMPSWTITACGLVITPGDYARSVA